MPIKLPSFRPRRDAYPPDLWTKCPSCGEMLLNKREHRCRVDRIGHREECRRGRHPLRLLGLRRRAQVGGWRRGYLDRTS